MVCAKMTGSALCRSACFTTRADRRWFCVNVPRKQFVDLQQAILRVQKEPEENFMRQM